LTHPTNAKFYPLRVAEICLRSAYNQVGNALSALGNDAEARAAYELGLPVIEREPRVHRLDWERNSLHTNIGNTYSREGNFDSANEHYNIAEQFGKDHVDAPDGNQIDGMGMMIVAMRARAFALKKVGRDDEAKSRLREVLDLQIKLNAAEEELKAKEKGESAPQTSSDVQSQ
jgi:tetratricopeptide (TPR) repeat protein